MKAIETAYKGYRFRSRLEARWAVFFDALGLRWEYEPEGFELPSGRYLPDFYLPLFGVYVEVKGREPGPNEIARCEELAAWSGSAVMLVRNDPDAGASWWGFVITDGGCGPSIQEGAAFVLWDEDAGNPHIVVSGCGGREYFFDCDFEKAAPTRTLTRMRTPVHAVAAFRGARFEFGESGARA